MFETFVCSSRGIVDRCGGTDGMKEAGMRELRLSRSVVESRQHGGLVNNLGRMQRRDEEVINTG